MARPSSTTGGWPPASPSAGGDAAAAHPDAPAPYAARTGHRRPSTTPAARWPAAPRRGPADAPAAPAATAPPRPLTRPGHRQQQRAGQPDQPVGHLPARGLPGCRRVRNPRQARIPSRRSSTRPSQRRGEHQQHRRAEPDRPAHRRRTPPAPATTASSRASGTNLSPRRISPHPHPRHPLTATGRTTPGRRTPSSMPRPASRPPDLTATPRDPARRSRTPPDGDPPQRLAHDRRAHLARRPAPARRT